MSLTLDPLGSLVDLILGIYKEKKVQNWFKLIFQIVYSGVITFMTSVGTTFLSTIKITNKLSLAWSISIATGLISSAVVMTYYFRKSSLTTGMMLVLPEEEATTEINTNLQTINK